MPRQGLRPLQPRHKWGLATLNPTPKQRGPTQTNYRAGNSMPRQGLRPLQPRHKWGLATLNPTPKQRGPTRTNYGAGNSMSRSERFRISRCICTVSPMYWSARASRR